MPSLLLDLIFLSIAFVGGVYYRSRPLAKTVLAYAFVVAVEVMTDRYGSGNEDGVIDLLDNLALASLAPLMVLVGLRLENQFRRLSLRAWVVVLALPASVLIAELTGRFSEDSYLFYFMIVALMTGSGAAAMLAGSAMMRNRGIYRQRLIAPAFALSVVFFVVVAMISDIDIPPETLINAMAGVAAACVPAMAGVSAGAALAMERMIEDSPDGLIAVDSLGRIIQLNPAAAELAHPAAPSPSVVRRRAYFRGFAKRNHSRKCTVACTKPVAIDSKTARPSSPFATSPTSWPLADWRKKRLRPEADFWPS